MEDAPIADGLAKLPIKICFTNIFILSARMARRVERGAAVVDCRTAEDRDWTGSDDDVANLALFVQFAERIHYFRTHMLDYVYVHCEKGKVRSVTSVGIHLLRHAGMPLEKTMTLLAEALGTRWVQKHSGRVLQWLQAYLERYPRR